MSTSNAVGIASSYALTTSPLAAETTISAELLGTASGLLPYEPWSAQLGTGLSRQLVAELGGLPGPGSLGFAANDGVVSTDIGIALFGQYAAVGLEPVAGAFADTLTNHTGTPQQSHAQLIAPPSHLVATN